MNLLDGDGGRLASTVVLTEFLAGVRQESAFNIGFPGGTDVRFPALAPLLTGQLLNNIGDPATSGFGAQHTKAFEREVVATIGDLFRAPATRWGYVTTGSTEAVLHALDEAWRSYPDVYVYTSTAA